MPKGYSKASIIQRLPDGRMELTELSTLSRKVDDLIVLCNRLRQENRILQASELAWKQERAQLIERNEMARTKVEAIISRLRALEQET